MKKEKKAFSLLHTHAHTHTCKQGFLINDTGLLINDAGASKWSSGKKINLNL